MSDSTPLIDIRPDHWKIVRDILKKHVPQYEVWAFGSRAKWNAKPYSDLDLAIITDNPLSLEISASLADEFSESDLPWKVDVIDWATTSQSFREIVERDKVVVQDRASDGWRSATVAELQRNGVLLVEDGNHGEYRPRKDEFAPTGVAFIRAADMDAGSVLFDSAAKINEQACRRITKGIGAPGDILLSHKGTVGKLALVPQDAPPFVCSPQTTFWRSLDTKILDRKYLYAFLRSPEFKAQLTSRAGETDMAPYVSLTSQRGLSVTLPPLLVQRAIAHILGTLDDKIELNRRRNETLEAMARALFKDWFVAFGPVRAKMEGCEPYLPADIWKLFPERLDDEGKPEGWRVAELREVATEIRRGISPSYLESGGVRVLNQKCIRNREINFGPSRRHDYNKRKIEGREVQAGDILVNSTGVGTLGRAAQLWRVEEPTVVDSHVSVVRPNLDVISVCYLGLNLTGRESEIEILGEGSTGQTELSRIRLGCLPVLLPSRRILNEFEKRVRPLLDEIFANTEGSTNLGQLRNTLLPKLISGELRVHDAARLVESGA